MMGPSIRTGRPVTWIVKVALDRPYTFIVLALMILIFGPLAAVRTPTDIFPNIGIPVIGVAFTYTGLSPDEVGARMLAPYERFLTTTVNDVEHVESVSMPGLGIVKIFFQPNVDIRLATAQVTSVSQTAIRQMPPGTQPPLILNYSASTVPVLSSWPSRPNRCRNSRCWTIRRISRGPRLTTVPGAAMPFSYGGKFRSVQIDLDPVAMQARGLSSVDVQNAFVAQNQINPAGNVKIGNYQYVVRLNNASDTIEGMNQLPVKTVAGGTVFLHDVAHVRDGNTVQNNIVHVDGARAVLSTVLKNGQASTIDVVQGIKDLLPMLREQLPPELKIDVMSDQSVFVKAAVKGVFYEGAIAAALTSLMILLFLGSWRSTVIIATSIPLAVLAALMGLWATGQTLNIMTLGRAGAGGRHPGGRRHRDHREHQLAPGTGQGRLRIHHGRRAPDHPAGLCQLAVHLRRLRADVRAAGHCGLPVRAHGAGGGIRHDRLLHPVAHPGADPVALSAQAARPSWRKAITYWRGCSAASSAASTM